jgi:hypothetical protein
VSKVDIIEVMKFFPKAPISWDLMVFFGMTSLALGFSLNELKKSGLENLGIDRELAAYTENLATEDDGGGIYREVALLEVGCLDRKSGTDRVFLDGGKVRLRGSFCNLGRKEQGKVQGLKIRNLSSGIDGTVFFHGGTFSFTTDALALVQGKNAIQLEWTDSTTDETKSYLTEIFEK